MNKYEKLIEYIINDQESQARELFHEIVVEKSRDIYESLLADEQGVEETVGGNEVEDLVDEITADEEGISEEDMEVDAEMGGDEEMDFGGDEEEFGSEEEAGEEAIEDRVMDLEDALDELKAEFDKLMGEVDADSDGDHDMADHGEEEVKAEESVIEAKDEDEAEEDKEEVAEDDGQAELDKLREYVEKVAGVSNTEGADNKASVVAGKNDMGGSAKNLAQGGEEQGGKVKAPATINSGNKNVPGAKAGSLEKAPAPKKAE
jgi:hypothetical protein